MYPARPAVSLSTSPPRGIPIDFDSHARLAGLGDARGHRSAGRRCGWRCRCDGRRPVGWSLHLGTCACRDAVRGHGKRPPTVKVQDHVVRELQAVRTRPSDWIIRSRPMQNITGAVV